MRSWVSAQHHLYGRHSNLWERSLIMPAILGVSLTKPEEAREILVVGDVSRSNIILYVPIILALTHGNSFRVTFNTTAAYILRVEEGNDKYLPRSIIVFLEPYVYVNPETLYLFPDVDDHDWSRHWYKILRPDIYAIYRLPTSSLFLASDTYSGQGRREFSVEPPLDPATGSVFNHRKSKLNRSLPLGLALLEYRKEEARELLRKNERNDREIKRAKLRSGRSCPPVQDNHHVHSSDEDERSVHGFERSHRSVVHQSESDLSSIRGEAARHEHHFQIPNQGAISSLGDTSESFLNLAPAEIVSASSNLHTSYHPTPAYTPSYLSVNHGSTSDPAPAAPPIPVTSTMRDPNLSIMSANPSFFNPLTTTTVMPGISLQNNMRIYTLEEKPILTWCYKNIMASFEWFNKSKTADENENKVLMGRIILADKQAGAQSAITAHFIQTKDLPNIKANTQWYRVDTALQWRIYLKFYGDAIDSINNPHLTMGERLRMAMRRIPTIGDEVEALSKALEKGCIDLLWEDFIDGPGGQIKTNPKNNEVIKQFIHALDEDEKTKAYFKTAILEGQDLDQLGEIKSLRVMVGRMHLYLERIKSAESLLLSMGRRRGDNRALRHSSTNQGSSPSNGHPSNGGNPPSNGGNPPGNGGANLGGAKSQDRGKQDSSKKINPARATMMREVTCSGCGHKGHVSGACPLKNLPQFNKEQCRWSESTNGKILQALGQTCLPKPKEVDETGMYFYESLLALTGQNPVLSKHGLSAWVNGDGYPISCLTLIDTGALQGTYVDSKTAFRLLSAGRAVARDNISTVCGAVGSDCKRATRIVRFLLSFLASSGLEETIELDGIVLDIPFDVIVGEPDIIRYDLLPIVMARYSRQDTCLLES